MLSGVLSEGVLLCQSRSYLCSEVLLCDVVLFLYLLVCMMMVVVEERNSGRVNKGRA